MSHTHHHHSANQDRLFIAATLTGVFMVAEVVGGLYSNSLALIADAGHMLTDFASLMLAWIAARIAHKPADTLRTYGYHRIQILASFINGIAFVIVVIWILVEAIQRIMQPAEILTGTMMIIAVIGLIINIVVFFILHGANQSDLNVKGAMIHVVGDLLGSVAAIVAAVVIMLTGWTTIDPILSVLVALLVLRSAWYIVRHSAHILMEGAPDDIDVQQLRLTLTERIPEVVDVHHIHIWSLTPDRPLLTAHIRVNNTANYEQVLQAIKKVMAEKFSVFHSTIQIEIENCIDHN